MRIVLSICFYSIMLFYFSPIYGQSETEIGLQFTGLDNFDLLYKKKRGENKWFRLRGSNLTIGYLDREDIDAFNLEIGFGIGTEYRKYLGDGISFIHGPEFFASFMYQKNGSSKRYGIAPGFGYLLGFRYEINDRFSISIESRPSIRTDFNWGMGIEQFSAVGTFDVNAIGVGLAYRFKKE